MYIKTNWNQNNLITWITYFDLILKIHIYNGSLWSAQSLTEKLMLRTDYSQKLTKLQKTLSSKWGKKSKISRFGLNFEVCALNTWFIKAISIIRMNSQEFPEINKVQYANYFFFFKNMAEMCRSTLGTSEHLGSQRETKKFHPHKPRCESV